MDVSRRRFLGAFSASVAALLSFTSGARGGKEFAGLIGRVRPSGLTFDALSQLGWSSFYENLETDFDFSSLQGGRRGARPARLRLVSIKDEDLLRKGGSVNESRCFVLTFSQSSRATPLRQDTYAVDHFALGRFELFISDAGINDNGFTYTAVINRIAG
jgi:hypothetical protein